MQDEYLIYLMAFTIIFLSVTNYYFYRQSNKLAEILKIQIKHHYNSQINWITHSKDKLRFLKKLGIFFPLEEVALKKHEDVVIELYTKDFDAIEGDIKQKLND